MKICIRCHKEYLEGRFCLECGGELKEQSSEHKEKNAGVSLGDKNVVAGDIIGQKEEYKITGNSTFIKNEDETRKIINCNICGKNEMIIDSVRCPSCLTSVCKDHFNYTTNRCTNCEKNAESEYRTLLGQVLEDGKMDQNERIILNSRAKQYKISADRALEIELDFKNQSKKIDSQSLNAFDKIELKKIKKEITTGNDLVPVFERIGRLYSKYSNNEEIKKLYFQIGPHALGVAFLEKLSQNFDELYAEIAKIDIEILENKDLTTAIDKLDLIKEKYPERELDINAKELDIFYRLYEIEGDEYVEPIEDLLKSILAKNWQESDYAGYILYKIFNDKKIVFQDATLNSFGEDFEIRNFDENMLVHLHSFSRKVNRIINHPRAKENSPVLINQHSNSTTIAPPLLTQTDFHKALMDEGIIFLPNDNKENLLIIINSAVKENHLIFNVDTKNPFNVHVTICRRGVLINGIEIDTDLPPQRIYVTSIISFADISLQLENISDSTLGLNIFSEKTKKRILIPKNNFIVSGKLVPETIPEYLKIFTSCEELIPKLIVTDNNGIFTYNITSPLTRIGKYELVRKFSSDISIKDDTLNCKYLKNNTLIYLFSFYIGKYYILGITFNNEIIGYKSNFTNIAYNLLEKEMRFEIEIFSVKIIFKLTP